MTGKIKYLAAPEKGFFFITPDDGSPDVFGHKSALSNIAFDALAKGTRVTFEVEQGAKGPRAVRISA